MGAVGQLHFTADRVKLCMDEYITDICIEDKVTNGKTALIHSGLFFSINGLL